MTNVFHDALIGLEAQSIAAIPRNECDYEQDGLLYCGKCHTPKQAMIEIYGTIHKPMCMCKCENERYEREKKEAEHRSRMARLDSLRKEGFPDADLEKCTFDKDDGGSPKIMRVAKNYASNFSEMKRRGKGLVFFGGVGTGKTFAAACIANALISKGIPCMVTNFARLTNTLFGMNENKQSYIDGLNQYELLVIDDLASERDTEYMQETVMNIIDSRYRSGLPIIVTTNLTAQQLKSPSDVRRERIFSRLMEMCVLIEADGKDRRKAKLRQDYQELSELLGIGGNE